MGTSLVWYLVATNIGSILGAIGAVGRWVANKKDKKAAQEALVNVVKAVEDVGSSYTTATNAPAASNAVLALQVVNQIKEAVTTKQALTMSPPAAEAVATAISIVDPKKESQTF